MLFYRGGKAPFLLENEEDKKDELSINDSITEEESFVTNTDEITLNFFERRN